MTMHFGDRSHVHMSYLRQPLFRDTSLMDRILCMLHQADLSFMSTVRFKYRKGTKLILQSVYMSLKLCGAVTEPKTPKIYSYCM